MKDINDDLLQFLLNRLHEGYSEYKRNHPDFAQVVEEQLEGKTDSEFEAQFTKKKPRCESCGEGLEWFENMCDQCGRLQTS